MKGARSKTLWEIVPVLLGAIAIIGLVSAWWLYPAENRFSIMRCTISFLGSPDVERNPAGWRFYQAGMTALWLLLFNLVLARHRRLRAPIGRAMAWSSGAIMVALCLLVLVVWIPDSRQPGWLGLRVGDWHTRLAILAIPFMGLGIAVDALALWVGGVNWRALWPFQLYGIIALVGAVMLAKWEATCRRDPTLPHWPGEGLHSTPLWEWIMFSYLIGFMIWLAHGRLPNDGKAGQTQEVADATSAGVVTQMAGEQQAEQRKR